MRGICRILSWTKAHAHKQTHKRPPKRIPINECFVCVVCCVLFVVRYLLSHSVVVRHTLSGGWGLTFEQLSSQLLEFIRNSEL